MPNLFMWEVTRRVEFQCHKCASSQHFATTIHNSLTLPIKSGRTPTHAIMITTMRLLLPLLLVTGKIAFGQENFCQFEVHMFSNATTNDCFQGWSLLQAANLAKPLLKSYQEMKYPQLIDPNDQYYGVKTLTTVEYNALSGNEKKMYETSMEDWGWNTAFNLNFPYCKDQGYRKGWKKEYDDKLQSEDQDSDFIPLAAPTDEIPEQPGPKPELVTTAQYTKWYVDGYKKGWKKACDDGFKEGEEEGKRNGKLALESGTEYSLAYSSGFKKGYNDGMLGLGSPMNRRRNRQLRSVERDVGEDYSNGYSQGYIEALTAQAKKQPGSHNKQRHLASTCTRWCYSSKSRYNYCLVIGWCDNSYRRQLRELDKSSESSDGDWDEDEWRSTYVETLPLNGVSGGEDFKNLIAHVLDKKCKVEDVGFEIWERCPVQQV